MCLRKYISLRGERKQYKAHHLAMNHSSRPEADTKQNTVITNHQGGDLTDPHHEREKALTTQPEPKDQLPQTPD